MAKNYLYYSGEVYYMGTPIINFVLGIGGGIAYMAVDNDPAGQFDDGTLLTSPAASQRRARVLGSRRGTRTATPNQAAHRSSSPASSQRQALGNTHHRSWPWFLLSSPTQ